MKKIIKFLLLWTMTYWVNIYLTHLLISEFSFSPNLSYSISLTLITLINFFMSLKLIFRTTFSFILLIRYTIALISFSLINYFLVFIISPYFPIKYYYFIIFIVTTFIFLIKFIVYDKYVFKRQKSL